ncbi:AzlD domain-containing protein [Myxococcus sp. MISCRS1]|jgi:branched-subunit amino acid transport protein|uniref:AzlD domain-containing protein n=1 Tax=Myxococcus TaxID=32 RepID=UPI0011447A9E|nr:MULTISPECIES: AzlD domain-containing protein [Myxococcus]MBZ4395130.1 AzlD domain-containing protein [Myxococcus sp. AS-1-15]MCK8502772.1 AzlD domain-containing protein [Myxococcus fulvus]MCY1002116.1 AzlD domain-containing protein [Myxococcus sp. MISCRS1]BDT36311.1 AzlD domain-containing protein [Myxococcus sp. MH1]
MTLLPILVLALGTYGFRVAGPLLSERLKLSARVQERMALATIAMLAALVATSTLLAQGGLAGWARPTGVLVGAVLACLRLPFIAVVVAAAATAAGLRLLGVP